MKAVEKQNTDAARRAGEIFTAMREPGLDEAMRVALEDELLSSPAMMRVYSELERIWEDVHALGQDPEVEAIVKSAGADGADGAAAPGSRSPESPRRRSSVSGWSARKRLRPLMAGLGAGLAACFAIAAVSLYQSMSTPFYEEDFATAPGEQQTVALEDGSTIVINTASRLDVSVDDRARRVGLARGQAYFDVSPDPARPFTVEAGDVHIKVLGTKFDVYRRPADTVVSVVEGLVSVATSGDEAQIGPGEAVSVNRDGDISEPRPVAEEQIARWRFGIVDFVNTPMKSVLAEINRYGGPRALVIDPEVESMNVTAVFHIKDMDQIFDILSESYDLKTEEVGGQIRLRKNTEE